jgi:hypothetical protein
MMRDSLKLVLSRVERLATQVTSSRDVDVSKMTDGELEAGLMYLAEKAAGRPASAFPTAEAFIDACEAGFCPDALSPEVADVMRAHWTRQRWFIDHDAHGDLTLDRPANGGITATCSCGAHLSMDCELVPVKFRDRLRPIPTRSGASPGSASASLSWMRNL